jgi:hypothetical protein
VAAASSAISGSHVVALLFYSKSIVEREGERRREERVYISCKANTKKML